MENYDILYKILFSLVLGFLIGLEREYKVKEEVFAGIRTFPLISLLGLISAFVNDKFWNEALLISFLAIIGFSLVNFFLEYAKYKGVTTEVSILITFLIGVLTYHNQYYTALFIALLTTLILALKKPLENFAKSLYFQDVMTILKFAFLTAVIYPILPDKSYGPFDAFNPKEIWKVVIIISAIDFIGYFLLRWKGAKSLVLVGFFGGLVSSTAITYNFSILSRKLEKKEILILGIIIAWIVMNLRIIFLAGIFNINLLALILPAFLTIIATQLFFIKKYSKYLNSYSEEENTNQFQETFSILNILQFAFIYAVVVFLMKALKYYYGLVGIYFVSFISGVIDVDAITISASNLTKSGSIELIFGAIIILLAVFSNTMFKYIYVLIFADDYLKKEILKITLFTLVLLIFFVLFSFIQYFQILPK